ncbi:MAG TPA: hypothetical protein VHU15_17730 [Stellaceae bacterium]|nr:hypothetical protein [Stellaceae bacterium]
MAVLRGAHRPAQYWRFLAGFAATVPVLLGLLAAVNYVVDPLHYYRGLNAINPVFLGAELQRYLNVGLARNFRYDTVVIGSSVTENFLPSYLGKSWGVRAMKLSISGSTSYEQRLILEQALQTGQVRNVIWAVDFGFYGGAKRVRDDEAPFPYHMYRRWPLPNFEYLLSLSTLSYSIKVLKGYGETDLDTLETWYGRFEFSRSALLKSWGGDCALFAHPYQEGHSHLPATVETEMQAAVQQNLKAVVMAHPQVRFDVFFPPVATLFYIPADGGNLVNALPLRRAVAEAVADLPNVRLSDFQTDPRLTDALDRYKDPVHFDLTTTNYIMDALRDGRYRIRAADIAESNQRLIRHVSEYTICRDGELAATAHAVRSAD